MKIYGTFLQGHMRKFNESVQELGTKVLQAALALHEKVSTTFRKTAINFHYEFTVRHLANVFQVRTSLKEASFTSVAKPRAENRGLFKEACLTLTRGLLNLTKS
jgi:dynein heavy chain